ncbi:MAG: ferritin-like domain-containing protein, partial [Delftia sp.]|nr:ferritin-like domain-containing protein [Delftia sp.]
MPDSGRGARHARALPASPLPVIDRQRLGFHAGPPRLVKHALAAL